MQPDKFTLRDWPATHRLLDKGVLSSLLLGVTNKMHLVHIANECAAKASRSEPLPALLHLRVATDCLLLALEQDMLDPVVIQGVLALDQHSKLLTPERRAILKAQATLLENSGELLATARKVLAAHGLGFGAGGQSPPLHEIFQQLLNGQALTAAGALLDHLDSTGLLERSGPLRAVAMKLAGDVHLLERDYARAGECYALAREDFPEIVLERGAHALLLLGERARACQAFVDIVRQRPWRTNALLRCFDLLEERDLGSAKIQETSVLLYTFNHDEDLDKTLKSLAASDAASCDVFVLVNGCSDDTGQVVEKWAGSGAFPQFEPVMLPINIGAPAARDWLLSMERVMANPCIAYLDDDIVLPGDWLQRLFLGRELYPDAGVWGAKVREFGTSHTLQQVDLNLYYPPRKDEFIGFSDLQSLSPDAGQFDYMRPAASVTGCCHLFKREVFETVGNFDIRFSPSQYDDFDHSLRIVQAGMYSVYTGHASIEHRRVSGKAAAMNQASYCNVMGNLKKLEGKYDEAARRDIVTRMDATLLEDYLRKLYALRKMLKD